MVRHKIRGEGTDFHPVPRAQVARWGVDDGSLEEGDTAILVEGNRVFWRTPACSMKMKEGGWERRRINSQGSKPFLRRLLTLEVH